MEEELCGAGAGASLQDLIDTGKETWRLCGTVRKEVEFNASKSHRTYSDWISLIDEGESVKVA